MRVIGLDIHRVFAEAAALEGGSLIRLGRIEMRRDRLAAFARSLTHDVYKSALDLSDSIR